jgi:hypothetical protein
MERSKSAKIIYTNLRINKINNIIKKRDESMGGAL